MLKSLALSAALALAACAAAPDKTTAVKTPVASAKPPAGLCRPDGHPYSAEG